VKKYIGIILALVLLLSCGIVGKRIFAPLAPVEVVGTLSPDDVTEIERIVRYRIATTRLKRSWRKAWNIPAAISYYRVHPIVRIEVQSSNTTRVLFRETERRSDVGYDLSKSTNGWKITGVVFN
jgi:hypothetical protein